MDSALPEPPGAPEDDGRRRRRSTRPEPLDAADEAVEQAPLPATRARAPRATPDGARTDRRADRPRDERPREERDRPREERDRPRDDERPASRGRVPEPVVHARPDLAARIDPDAAKVLRRLARAGHTAYLVGGGVRDLLLGRTPKDFDIATSARPGEVRGLFRNCRVIGRRFRLAHILFHGGKIVEVATFRRDPTADDAPEEVEQDGAEDAVATPRKKDRGDDADLLIRHDNVFGDPHEDAVRRDFTINGLFYDLEREEVIDYVGGVPDVLAKVVRTIGEPDVRFREDPVRMLRAIKFGARLDMGLAPELYDAMCGQREELHKSAKARVVEEVLRLLRGGAAHRSIFLAWDTGVLGVVLPELAAWLDDDAAGCAHLWGRLRGIDRLVRQRALPSDPLLLAALLEGPVLESMDDARDPQAAFDEFFDHVTLSLAIPRRMKDRMRLVLLSQRRMRTKWQSLSRRDFFEDAAVLYALDLESQGLEVPSWAKQQRRRED